MTKKQHDGEGPDVDPVTGDEAETFYPDAESIFDPLEVKGPDPAVWGNDASRPSPFPPEEVSFVDGVTVKGPDPEVWRD